MCKQKILILSFFLFGFIAPSAFATIDFHVREEVSVRDRPAPDGKVIYVLKDGDTAVVAPRFFQDGWRKIRVKPQEGQPVIGYVDSKNLRLSFFKDRKDLAKERGYRERYGLGGSVMVTYLLQESEDVTAGTSETFKPGKLASASYGLAGYFDFPMEAAKVRLYTVTRVNNFTGQGNSTQGNNLSLTLSETLLGVGGSVRFYINERSKFWFGVGGEMDKVIAHKTKVSNDYEAEEDPPFYFMGTLNFGWDHKLFAGTFLMPEFRLMLNFSPITYGGEFVLSGGIGF